MRYAVVKIGGQQHRVLEGAELEAFRLEAKKGDKIKFEEVLLGVDGDGVVVGKPFIEKAFVSAEVIDQLKGKKIRVAIYRAKSRYRRVKGHRDKLTKIKIEKISFA